MLSGPERLEQLSASRHLDDRVMYVREDQLDSGWTAASR